ncbi:MAG: Holliday junction resolvase RuvX [Rickettsiaceae bacterium]|nr:Holliday junction resolvase RuvX [Rickettsiaceae bacterium]
MIIHTFQEFCKFFRPGFPILSIDYGSTKIGLAMSTPDYTMSMPLQIIRGESEKKKLQEIVGITVDKNICAIVIGLPINMDSTPSEQTLIIEKFAEKLKNRTNLPIFLQDERLTSRLADNLLKGFGLKRKERNAQDDLVAANLILETVLNTYNTFSKSSLIDQ